MVSRLAKTIYDEFNEKPDSVEWSDSKVVLHWLRSHSSHMKAFVGVCVAEIQSTWNEEHWGYVPTNLNPADDLSRGIPSEELDSRWMKGPTFLRKLRKEWPAEKLNTLMANDPEMKNAKHKPLGAIVHNQNILKPSTFSSWQRLMERKRLDTRFPVTKYARTSDPTRDGSSRELLDKVGTEGPGRLGESLQRFGTIC